ncbi:VOC family protein [Deinococcus cellulosilyticus]|uniref:Glyoxalase n=1 Tax=Deinococcus cellulosilyticus (strain DSM 18568 / NBRC 106333 / KACC 11606 / 5516J-15) TaxID=1223518 RepID=A0A511N9P7_DEIC1|nr:VOC family protein [Deinococcus cellulosilyticus]GEM49520.1 glyoxalase [Deinococcus cellulosilyticus NBRC 106333 = KACC 11606]
MINGLDHVLVPAPRHSEEAARKFYGSFLGLTEIEKPAALQGRGGLWFGLPDGRQIHVGIDEPFVPQKKAHPCFRTADLQQVMGHFEQHQVAYTLDTTLEVHRIFTTDPFGNRLEIVQGAHITTPLT